MSEIKEVFQRQNANVLSLRNSSAKVRVSKLKKLREELIKAREEFQEAMALDFKKPAPEVDLTELLPLISEINYYCKNLKSWTRPKKVKTPLFYKGTSSVVKYESKGKCLIISPWNYPVNLSLMPLVAAVAAGNTVILKPSEFTPATNKVIERLLSKIFSQDEVCVFQGEREVSQELLSLAFDHIFFTGSTPVGRIVMEAAAKIPCPVTLELGGKSPTIVDDEVDLERAVEKIAWGKWLNAGQTCIAPDYVLISSKLKDRFISLFKEKINHFRGQSEDDFGGIISEHHYRRLKKMREELGQEGVECHQLTKENEAQRKFPLTLLVNPPRDAQIMKEEIFGPLLPIITLDSLEEKTKFVRSFDPPLSLYVFSKNSSHVDKVLNECQAGGTTVNDTIYHIANHCLPFGGVTQSGIGKYHGKHGFEELSHHRAVMKRHFDLGLSYFYPPYGKRLKKLLDLMLNKLYKFI